MEQLPWIVQRKLLGMLSLSDLENLKKVSTHFRHLISIEYDYWIQNSPLVNILPYSETIPGLLRLATLNNLEATIKLAAMLPYQNGQVLSLKGPEEYTVLAAEQFWTLESTAKLKYPLTWVLIRPPWSDSKVCRKAMVHDHLMRLIEQRTNSANMCYCIAKVLMLLQSVEHLTQAKSWLEKACRLGSIDAQYQLWRWKLGDMTGTNEKLLEELYSELEPGMRLNLIRELHSIASTMYEPAEIQLCRLYARGHHDGVTTVQAHRTVKNFFARSRHYRNKEFHNIQSEITSPMRYILVDWLMEVAITKNFSTSILHATVQCLDRFLALRLVSRKNFQLIGIACMVLCSRSMESDILTIREAAWFTDSSFKYRDVVNTIGDIVSSLQGTIKLPTVIDYLDILLMMPNISDRVKFFARFIADSCLLYTEVGLLSQALVACYCVLIANLTFNPGSDAWNSEMEHITGFSKSDLHCNSLLLHEECFLMHARPVEVKHCALDEKYKNCAYGPITRDKIASYAQVFEFFDKGNTSTRNYQCIARWLGTGDDHRVHTDNPWSTSNRALDTESETSDEDVDADTPPNVFPACALDADVKSHERIVPEEDSEGDAAVLSSLNCDVACAVANRDNTGSYGQLGIDSSSIRSQTYSDENTTPNAAQREPGGSYKDEEARSSGDSNSNLPASKSMKLMR